MLRPARGLASLLQHVLATVGSGLDHKLSSLGEWRTPILKRLTCPNHQTDPCTTVLGRSIILRHQNNSAYTDL